MCSNMTNEKSDELFNSDSNPTMLASKAFDSVLDQIKNSCLNFHIQLSPFSAIISLKRSFIRDKSGNLLLPPICPVPSEVVHQNLNLEKEETVLKKMHEKAVRDCKDAHGIIESLKNTLKEEKVKLDEATDKIENLTNSLKKRDSEISNLKGALKTSKEVSEKLNKSCNENRAKYEQEKDQLSKVYNKEIKSCRKNFMDVKNLNSKLNEELAMKDDKLCEVFKEKEALEEKIASLLDALYGGCPECGLDSCECDDYNIKEEDYKSEDSSSPQYRASQPSPPLTPSAHPLPPPGNVLHSDSGEYPPPSSGISSWTPPPTPPCTSCGGINFGPSPSELCFVCIPPIESKPSHISSSPSWTPPGTPPTSRMETVSSSRNQPGQDSKTNSSD